MPNFINVSIIVFAQWSGNESVTVLRVINETTEEPNFKAAVDARGLKA